MSSSPEKLGRSSKSRTKSPCSPQAVGDAVAVPEVLLEAVLPELALSDTVVVAELDVVDEEPPVVLSGLVLSVEVGVSEELDEVDDRSEAWPSAREDWVLDVAELRLEDVATAGALARELPIDDKA